MVIFSTVRTSTTQHTTSSAKGTYQTQPSGLPATEVCQKEVIYRRVWSVAEVIFATARVVELTVSVR